MQGNSGDLNPFFLDTSQQVSCKMQTGCGCGKGARGLGINGLVFLTDCTVDIGRIGIEMTVDDLLYRTIEFEVKNIVLLINGMCPADPS